MLLLKQIIVLFLLMGIGFFFYKKSIITDEVSKKISSIVVNIANPALVLSGGMGEERIQGEELLLTAAVAFFMYAALLLLAAVLPGLLHIEKKSRGTFRAMTVFSNIGFMGFPVINALYGSGALLYAAVFVIPYNVLIYTYGVSAMTAQREHPKEGKSFSPGRMFNAGTIACVAAIIIYLWGVPVPEFVKATITNLSNLTAPLSMMVIGASLAAIDLKGLFTDGKLLLFSGIKLVLLPVAGIWIIRQFVQTESMLGVCMVMLATPVGSMTAMLSQQYDGDYETASKGVALTTILSVVTMPLVSWIAL